MKQIDPGNKKKFGLIGYPLGHSLSPYIHMDIMKKAGIRGSYKLYEITPDEFDDKADQFLNTLDGANVTIPYKEKVIPHIGGLKGDADILGAVNTIYKGFGYSTDTEGLLRCKIPFNGSDVLLLGAGGAARAVLSVAIRSGCRTIGIWARREVQTRTLKNEFESVFCDQTFFIEPSAEVLSEQTVLYKETGRSYDLIINATPAGMWPDCGMCPVSRDLLLSAGYVYDLIYNPLATKLVLQARSLKIRSESGLGMLIAQAAASQEIWNPSADFSGLSPLRLQQRLKYRMLELFPVKIILNGFMGSGKSTVGKVLAGALHIKHLDLDDVIVENSGVTVSEIFRSQGESVFRSMESDLLSTIMKRPESLVVSVGGGALLNDKNIDIVRKNRGFVFFLNADISTILERTAGDITRPLLASRSPGEIETLLTERMPHYIKTADYVTEASSDVQAVVSEIKTALGF